MASTAEQVTLQEFLRQNREADLLRITTAGSVDDGKSTLIGRLLHDAKGIFEDQLASIRALAEHSRSEEIDFAMITDGLKSEREQGITIDVAYRYFSTPNRRFIIADTPGHEQYTRNMATGASTATLALILVDAKKGITTQTKRHTFISSLLGISHVVVAVNKMDLVDYSRKRFEQIESEITDYAAKLNIDTIRFIPVSALKGDNVIEKSDRMPWYRGEPLLDYLESVSVVSTRNLIDFRFPVQYVQWFGEGFRGYAGTISSGVIRVGEEITVLPSGRVSRISRIITWEGDREYAFAPQAVTICLEDELDIGRGDIIARPGNMPHRITAAEANLVWMHEDPLIPGRQYRVKHTTNLSRGVVSSIKYRMDPENLHRQQTGSLQLNEIGKVRLDLFRPLLADEYDDNRYTGAFILIDPVTNLTVAAGMITRCLAEEDTLRPTAGTAGTPSPVTLWCSGPRAAEVAEATAHALRRVQTPALLLDERVTAQGLNADLHGADGGEPFRRLAHIARLAGESGIHSVVATEEPPGDEARAIAGGEELFTWSGGEDHSPDEEARTLLRSVPQLKELF